MAANKTVKEAIKPESREELLDRLYRLVGLRKVKEEITWISEYVEFVQMRQQNGFNDALPSMHMLFTGHPGTGKNTVAGMIGGLFCSYGILTHGKVKHYRRRDLVQDGYAVEEQLVRQAIVDSVGGILFIDQAGDLFNPGNPADRGILALNILMNILSAEKPEVIVILADDAGEIEDMQNGLPDLKQLFTRQLCFEDYTPEELMQITRVKLETRQYSFTPEAEDKFFKLLKTIYAAQRTDFENGCFIDEQIDAVAMRMAKRLMANKAGGYKREDMMLIDAADIVMVEETTPGKSFEKLNAMIGEEQLKQSIINHLNYVYFIRERQKQGFEDVLPPLHMIFTGSQGTGKTTVAQMIGEIYHSIGILTNSVVLVQNGNNLSAETGIPPEQAAGMLLDEAEGGILYINDASVLTKTRTGLAFFQALLSLISPEKFDGTLVILADYPDEIEKMLQISPGLKTFFAYQFNFKDYTPEELLHIAVARLEDRKYSLHPAAKEMIEQLINQIYAVRDKHFGNALLIDKLVDTAIRNMSARIMKIRTERELTRKEITTIMATDIPQDILKAPKFYKDAFDEKAITDALNDLDKMVGQTKIKQQIHNFVELARHYNQQGVKLNTKMSLQWCFTGNSGMGKGTVARIIARIYKAMGIIDKDVVCDFKAEKLVGQTEDDAQRMLGEALLKANGGILLFDEDSKKLADAEGFRERVRAILVNQMAERPGAYNVIYAGRAPVLNRFRDDVEKGADIINILSFEDYTKEELLLILKRKLADENMKLTYSAQQLMAEFVAGLTTTEERTHSSARLMRVVAELMIRNCIQRLAKTGKSIMDNSVLASVVKADVAMFNEAFIVEMMNERKKIGFR